MQNVMLLSKVQGLCIHCKSISMQDRFTVRLHSSLTVHSYFLRQEGCGKRINLLNFPARDQSTRKFLPEDKKLVKLDFLYILQRRTWKRNFNTPQVQRSAERKVLTRFSYNPVDNTRNNELTFFYFFLSNCV